MTVTTLDPKTALIVIDLQKGIIGNGGMLNPIEDVVKNAADLAAAFRLRGLPVVLVTAGGGAPGRTEQARGGPVGERPAEYLELAPELNPQPTDIRVTKRTPGVFTSTSLAGTLKDQGVTQVVLAGVATSNGVENSARQAYEFGFNVTLAIDAMTDRSAENQAWSFTKVFPRIGESGTTKEILALLESSQA
jgi:nicotinamidase-related amidase